MKKSILSSVFILLTILVNGQSSKLSVGITGSPDYYNYQFKSIAGFPEEYKTKLNYSLGILMDYNFSEKFSFQTGLIYSTKGYNVNYSWIGSDLNDPAIPLTSRFNINYLDIPILVSYNFLNKENFSLFTSAGIVTSFLTDEKVVSKMGDGSESETEFSNITENQKLNNILFAADVELGLKYNVTEKLYISVAPYLRAGLIKINDQVLESNPISFGANFGLHFKL
jgi:Outer membrane protein beta-barrel domain